MLTVSAKERTPLLDPGVYPAVCSMVLDLGTQYNATYNKSEPMVRLVWEIAGETVKIEGQELPRLIFKDYTAYLCDRSNLFKALTSWRGKPFTPEELKNFDLANLLGACCLLQLIHKTSQRDNVYAAVENIMALPKGTAKLKPSKTVRFDLDDPETYVVFETLPRYTQEKIAEAEEFGKTGLTLPERPVRGAAKAPDRPACGDFEEIVTDDDDGDMAF